MFGFTLPSWYLLKDMRELTGWWELAGDQIGTKWGKYHGGLKYLCFYRKIIHFKMVTLTPMLGIGLHHITLLLIIFL